MWSRGDVIAGRNLWYRRVRAASPAFVVEDTPQRLVFWVPIRSSYMGPEPRGVPTEWELVAGAWIDSGLVVHHWGERWLATHVRPETRSAWWYVDIVDSVRRTTRSFDYRDLLLDVATDDGVRLLDEDELAEAVELGVVTNDESRDVERVAAHVVELIERRAPPFDGEWDDWEPPPEWGLPSLPESWNDV